MTLAQLFGRSPRANSRKPTTRVRFPDKPSVGATICASDLRMTVQAGLSNELWVWLVRNGWRELQAGEDRYRLRAIPSSAVSRLFDAPAERWEEMLAAALRQLNGREPVPA
jgi:hypothetical protein